MPFVLPQLDHERKDAAMYRGLLGYFPAALFRVAQHSVHSNRKHTPDDASGPHWARGKSADHLDALLRHVCELHADPEYHLAAIAWRALAALQEHEERKGFKPGASSVFPEEP